MHCTLHSRCEQNHNDSGQDDKISKKHKAKEHNNYYGIFDISQYGTGSEVVM